MTRTFSATTRVGLLLLSLQAGVLAGTSPSVRPPSVKSTAFTSVPSASGRVFVDHLLFEAPGASRLTCGGLCSRRDNDCLTFTFTSRTSQGASRCRGYSAEVTSLDASSEASPGAKVYQIINEDECAPNPCQNGGSCADQLNGYTCNCPPGYTGPHCQTDINECETSPCQHGGTCEDQVDAFSCTCASGYTGSRCQTDINECESNPCQNGATCVDQVNAFACTCAPGYTESRCQTDINECETSPCQHGATCKERVNAFTCYCAPGYTGSSCQTDINECETGPCQHGATCEDQVNAFTCTCAPGYTGSRCQTDINECESSPCQNGGTCANQVNAFVCTCASGYTGSRCQTVLVNYCSPSPCQNGGTCISGSTAYTCQCPTGFGGSDCQDVTRLGSSGCTQADTTCISGICKCSPGYFYSIPQKTCITSCPAGSLSSEFVWYPAHNIRSYNLKLVYVNSAQLCKDACTARSDCQVAEYMGGACNLSAYTFLTAPAAHLVTNDDRWEHYQRKCNI